jgi:hypothetical protein
MTTPPPADIAVHLIGSGSLLRRDDEGCFAFVHQSVMVGCLTEKGVSKEARNPGGLGVTVQMQ